MAWLIALAACSGSGSSEAGPGSATSAGSGSATTSKTTAPAKDPAADLASAPIEPDPDGLFTTHVPLGKEPAIPPAFGALRPWMPRGEVDAARPADWKGKHFREHGDKTRGGVRWGYTTLAEAKYHRVTELTISLKRRDTRRRLIEAWGAPAMTKDDTACWVVKAAKLRACHRHTSFITGVTDEITLSAVQLLDDTLAASSPVAPAKLPALLGKSRKDVQAMFPDASEDRTGSKTNPSLVVPLAPSEYRMSWLPDTLEVGFEQDRATLVVLGFTSNDPARTQELADRVTREGKRAEGKGHVTKLAGAREVGDVTLVVSTP